MFFSLLALALLDVPIAIALGVVSAVAMVLSHGLDALPNLALVLFDGSANFPLIAVPLFILAGAIMNATGISRRLVALATALVGVMRGGLALGTILIPEMQRKGYPSPFAAAAASSAATLAVIIPPSIPMILYAAMAGTSVVELFVAGIVPGVLGGFRKMGVAHLMAVRYGLPVEQAFQLRRVWTALKDAGWALLLPVIILGGIFGGWVTATEGAGLAVLAAIVVGGVIYRELNWRQLRAATVEGGVQTAVVMLLVATSTLMSTYLAEAQVPQQLALSIAGLTRNSWAVLALLNVFFLVIGLFLHSAAAIVLVIPIVMPLVRAVGIDPVHFGLVVTLNLGIGQQTPPVASVLATACSIAKADIWDVTRVNLRFIAILLAVLVLVTYVPAVPLSLVNLFYR